MKKLFVRVLQVVLILALLFFLVAMFSGDGGRGILIVFDCVILLVFLLTLRIPLGKKQAAAPKQMSTSPPPSRKPALKETRIKMNFLPDRIDDQPIRYKYNFSIEPADGLDIVKDVLAGEEKLCDMVPDGDHINLELNGRVVALIRNEHKAKMVSDWVRDGRPMCARLVSSGKSAEIAFYDDPRPRNSFREQQVAELVSYKAEAKQETIAFLKNGDPLTLEDDEQGHFFVAYCTEEIGKLPKKIEARIEDEGEPWGLFVEELRTEETDEGDDIYRPVVRIYW